MLRQDPRPTRWAACCVVALAFAPAIAVPQTQIGLNGFGVRGGVDFNGGQGIFGATLDLGQILTPRLRLRPAGELGVWKGANTYTGSVEALYHFTSDAEVAIPYLGTGLALAGHDACGSDPDCPAVRWTIVLGFELRFRQTFNWLLEYRGMGEFSHNRLYIGLTTRRGS
ncbi:MAG TPA: hypothetical protein VMH88_09745 [Gemmatimonadales bacterium]|nr:hypothetical protein [Gemmatimonadales bacterium]